MPTGVYPRKNHKFLKSCLICSKEFFVLSYVVKRGFGKFCSKRCSHKNPVYKSKEFATRGAQNFIKFTKGHKPWNKGKKVLKISGPNNYNWKGGIYMDKDGYRCLMVKGNPSASRDGYVPEHRLVVEGCIGRYLQRGEVVHHINHNRIDNRPENLYLFPSQLAHRKFHAKEHQLISNII